MIYQHCVRARDVIKEPEVYAMVLFTDMERERRRIAEAGSKQLPPATSLTRCVQDMARCVQMSRQNHIGDLVHSQTQMYKPSAGGTPTYKPMGAQHKPRPGSRCHAIEVAQRSGLDGRVAWTKRRKANPRLLQHWQILL